MEINTIKNVKFKYFAGTNQSEISLLIIKKMLKQVKTLSYESCPLSYNH
jgi:hypothetical protein